MPFSKGTVGEPSSHELQIWTRVVKMELCPKAHGVAPTVGTGKEAESLPHGRVRRRHQGQAGALQWLGCSLCLSHTGMKYRKPSLHLHSLCPDAWRRRSTSTWMRRTRKRSANSREVLSSSNQWTSTRCCDGTAVGGLVVHIPAECCHAHPLPFGQE